MNARSNTLNLTLALLSLLLGLAFAGGAIAEDEEMLVTGSRSARPASSIPHAATVITGDELDQSISTSVADALRFVPGLQVTRQGGQGGRTELYLRGLDPNHVVVLIDGVRLNDPTNSRGGSFDPTTLALADIERIEIVRGPLSTVYGSDALAGAINIITRRADGETLPEASVRVRGGRFHTGNIIAQARTGLGGTAGLSLGAAIDTTRDPNSDGGYDGASLKAKLSATLPGEIEVDAFTRIHESSSRGFPDSSGGPELATLRSMEDRNVREILAGATLRNEAPNGIETAFRASYVSRREKLDAPGVDVIPPFDPTPAFLGGEQDIPRIRSGDEYRRWDLGLTTEADVVTVDLGSVPFNSHLLVGADAVWEDGEADAYLFDFLPSPPNPNPAPFPFFDHRRTIGVFSELEESIGEFLTISGSLRYDMIRGEKDRLSPAGGLTIKVPVQVVDLSLYGHYGEGFKLPSFYALGNPLVGDATLRTERSRGWEAGIRASDPEGTWNVRLSYFDLRVKDLIDFNDMTFALENQQRLISRGVELEFDVHPTERVDLRAGGTYNHTRFRGSSVEPEHRPRWRGFAELAYRPIDTLELSLRALVVSSSKASSFRTSPRVDTLNGYERFDVRAGWTACEGLELFLEIQNLTNSTPREAVGFEAPGIAPRAGLILRL